MSAVDVVVVGGSTAGVAAAVAAAQAGARVFLCAQQTYLGEDLCATLRLTCPEPPQTPLGRALFPDGRATTPLHAKKTLDAALLKAGVDFRYGCFATGVLRDAVGAPCGIVIANRSGRQAVTARVIIDATDRAAVAQLAGARRAPWPAGAQVFQRTIITAEGPVVDTVTMPMPDGGFPALARAEQTARLDTYRPGQLRAAERLFQVPPDPICGQQPASAWTGAPDLGHFQPEGVPYLYVLGGCADVPRETAERLLQPAAMIGIGDMIGRAAAVMAATRSESTTPRLPDDDLPVWAAYDVVVVGGGTAGANAAIGALRRGARVLVVEYQEGLGGTGTVGLIGMPYHGLEIGYTREVPFPGPDFTIEDKMAWYLREISRAGGDVWFGALGYRVLMDGARVTGVVVATPQGQGVVRARVVVDATGNGDLAAAAGTAMQFGADETDIALQGSGLPLRPLEAWYVNTDYLLVDESDVRDAWCAFAGVRAAVSEDAFDIGPMLQVRERWRIVGEHQLRYLDQILGRTYPDAVVYSSSDYDSHGYPSDRYFALLPHDEGSRVALHPAPGGACYTPYRCLLPRGVGGLLVCGTGISMERDASALVRMQRDMHNQGYAAGVAAAMAAAAGCDPRDIDLPALQRHLVEIGNLPAEVLTHAENFPLPEDTVRRAVDEVIADDRDRAARALAVILTHPAVARPRLLQAFATATGEARLTYAKLLGALGERVAMPMLIAALDAVPAWDEKILQGKMAEYAHLPTPVDALIWALGAAGDPAALPALLAKLAWLDAGVTLSHHRALALALERLAHPDAAEPLARLLEKPGMAGHDMPALEPLSSAPDKRRREGALREIVLARALYRCGDHAGQGEAILRAYTHDLRASFARHATAVLGMAPVPVLRQESPSPSRKEE